MGWEYVAELKAQMAVDYTEWGDTHFKKADNMKRDWKEFSKWIYPKNQTRYQNSKDPHARDIYAQLLTIYTLPKPPDFNSDDSGGGDDGGEDGGDGGGGESSSNTLYVILFIGGMVALFFGTIWFVKKKK